MIGTETRLGSEFSKSNPRAQAQSYAISFNGWHAHERAQNVYFCASDHVVSQVIAMTVDSEAAGNLVLTEWKQQFSTHLGEPRFDADEVEVALVSEQIRMPIRRSVAWFTGKHNIALTLGAVLGGASR